MKKILSASLLILFVVAGASAVSYAHSKKSDKPAKIVFSKASVELKMKMRELFEDHIVYTRNYIISALADLGDTEQVAKRLLRNQDEIGDVLKPFYGGNAGEKLTALLREHILIAAEVVKAAKMEKGEDLSAASKKWGENADHIAAFLSSANPAWTKDVLAEMLHKHLAFTTQEVVSRLKKDWDDDTQAYDKGHAHMLMLADILVDGIVKQFPSKFKESIKK